MPQITVITGQDRRRKWSSEERYQILAAAFAPGAVVSEVARRFDIVSSMIYKWRRQTEQASSSLAFVPAIVMEDITASFPPSQASIPAPASLPLRTTGISVEFPTGVRVAIDMTATAALITATLRALR